MKRKLFYTMTIMSSLVLFTVSAAPCAEQAAAAKVMDTTGMENASGQSGSESSVLDKFRTYAGPRTPKELSALFSTAATGKVRQQPLVALSDGSTALMVAIKVAATDNSAPGFAFNGAKMVTLQRKQNDEWLLKALPDKGVVSPSMMVSNNAGTSEYSLAVAPPLPAETDLSEQGFITFLAADRSTATASAQDLNQDGRFDFVDDYIFTANYLTKKITTGNDPESRRQRALKRTLSAPNSIPPQVPANKGYDGVFYGDQ